MKIMKHDQPISARFIVFTNLIASNDPVGNCRVAPFLRVTIRGIDEPHKLNQPCATHGPATNFCTHNGRGLGGLVRLKRGHRPHPSSNPVGSERLTSVQIQSQSSACAFVETAGVALVVSSGAASFNFHSRNSSFGYLSSRSLGTSNKSARVENFQGGLQ